MFKRPFLICTAVICVFAFGSCFTNSKMLAADAPVSDWHIAGPFGGSAKSVGIDPKNPNVVLAGGMNSLLYRSQDAGQSWQVLDFPKRNLSEVTCVLVDPSQSNHILAGMMSADGGGLFESLDDGKTWTGVNGMTGFGVRSLISAPSKPTRFISGTLHGVMVSDDSGKTWTRISDQQNMEMQGITAVAVDPQNADLIYAGTSHLPWKTTDGGKTWQSIHSGMIDDSDVFSFYVDGTNPQDIFASACSGIYASMNRGDLWKKLIGIPNTSRRTHVIRKDPVNSNVIFAGTTAGLFKSANDGTSWKTLTPAQVNSIVFDPEKAGQMFLAMEYEGIAKASEDGDHITLTNNGFVDRSISSVTRAGEKFVAIEPSFGETTAIFVSSDQGGSWKQMSDVKGLLNVHLRAITGQTSSDKTLIAAGPRAMYKSIDGGLLWKSLPVKVIVQETPAATTKRVVHMVKGKQVVTHTRVQGKPIDKLKTVAPSEFYALYTVQSGTKDIVFAATNLGLFKSADLGESWSLADLPGGLSVTGLFIAPNSDGRLFARSTTGLYFSSDFGDHWAKYNFPLQTGDINDMAIPVSHDAPLLVATRVGLYKTADGGATWYANNTGIPASTVSSVLYVGSANMAYAVEYGQLYESEDDGANWQLVHSALPNMPIRQLWMPDHTSSRLYGITTDLGILFRN